MAVNKDKLASSLADELNKKYKGSKVAFFLNDESTPTDVKDWVLAAIGSGAMKNSKNVVHYTLELNQNYVGWRYDTVFSGVTTSDIKFY
jgi:hypothetical protein